MKTFPWVLAAAAGLVALAVHAQETAPAPESKPEASAKPDLAPKKVCVIPIVGEINYTQNAFIRRAAAEARAAGAQLAIFEIDSPGGEIGAMMQMGVHILGLPDSGIETVAFILPKGEEGVGGNAYSAAAYLAMCAKKMYMHPGSVIGAAAPIFMGPEGIEEAGEKFVSATREKFRAVAEQNGYPPNLAVAMVDEEMQVLQVRVNGASQFLTPGEIDELRGKVSDVQEVREVCAKGKLLTLTQKQAIEYGMAKEASSRAALLEDLGVKATGELAFEFTWSETLVGFLTSPGFASLLLIVGILGIWIEMKTPGFGVPGIIGVLSFGVLLFGHHLAGLAEVTEILLFGVGVVLLAVEIFVLPGTGIFAILGVICVFSGLVLSFQDFVIPDPEMPDQMGRFLSSIGRVLFSFLASSVLFILVVRFLPKMPGFNRMILQAELAAESGAVSPMQDASISLVGKTGEALTPLRPGGKIEVGHRVYDVVAEGDFIEKGEAIRVLAIEGSRIVVGKIRKD